MVSAADVTLMLAETRDRPFSDDDWLFELKYDGYRLLVARDDGEPKLVYRRGGDATSTFPEIARALRSIPFKSFVMDGELVALDPEGRPSFQRLQQRSQLRRKTDIDRGAVEIPLTVFVFDLVAFEGRDLRSLPLVERKRALRDILHPERSAKASDPFADGPAAASDPIRYTDHVEGRGAELYREIAGHGLEGMMAKRKASPYRGGRTADWLKIPCERTGDFAIVGFSAPKGTRAGLGALHLALRDGNELRYAGRVGTGFDDRLLQSLRRRLEAKRRPTPPCAGDVPKSAGHVWVDPELVCEVRFKELTDEGLLRHGVFVRLRDDKQGLEAVEALRTDDEAAAGEKRGRGDRTIHFTNLDKVFWPKERYTKGDLIDYYRRVWPWLEPYLRDRPLVLTRYPDGIDGKSFYQKDAPHYVPDWIRTERMWSESAGREIDYFVADDVDSLLYLVNLGTIPLHLWSSRTTSLDRPDYCILDLDPKGAPFRDVVTTARAIHRLCDSIELVHFIKTSGATGLHILIPLGARFTYDQSRQLGELLADVINRELPDITTMVRKVSDRGGKVYLDYLQNRHGQTIAAPYSARPVPGATVSTPLEWREVNDELDPRKFTIRTLPKRLERRKRDPVVDVLTLDQDVVAALGRLAEREREARP